MKLSEDNIFKFKSFNSWKEALNTCAKPLINNEWINQNYIDSIIKNTEKYGPYYIIAPEIAIAHSDIDKNSVFKSSVIWNFIEKPILFIDKPVKHLIILCAISADEHQDFLKRFALMCMDKIKFANLIKIKVFDELKIFLKENI